MRNKSKHTWICLDIFWNLWGLPIACRILIDSDCNRLLCELFRIINNICCHADETGKGYRIKEHKWRTSQRLLLFVYSFWHTCLRNSPDFAFFSIQFAKIVQKNSTNLYYYYWSQVLQSKLWGFLRIWNLRKWNININYITYNGVPVYF